MKKYNDKELNRLLSESDELLADLNLNLYETPEEKQARKKKEEEKQQEAELRRIQEAERKKQRKLHREEIEQALYEVVVTKEEDPFEAAAAKEEDSLEAAAGKEEDSLETKTEEIQTEISLPKDNETIEPEPQLYSPSESKQAVNKNYSQAAGVLYMMISFMFMEAMTHLGAYGTLGTNFIYPLFFAASLGGVICLLSSFLHVKGNTIVAFLLQILFAAYCDLQLIYYAAMGTFLRLSQARDNMWLLVHSEQMKEAAAESLPWLVLMFLPIILWAVIGRRFIQFQQSHWLTKLVFLIGTVVFAVIGIIMLDLKGYEDYSPYAAFYNYESGMRTEQAGNQLGMTALTGLEILELFR